MGLGIGLGLGLGLGSASASLSASHVSVAMPPTTMPPTTMPPTTNPQVRKHVRAIVGAVKYMHAHGAVHRDLKPENVCLTLALLGLGYLLGLGLTLNRNGTRCCFPTPR